MVAVLDNCVDGAGACVCDVLREPCAARTVHGSLQVLWGPRRGLPRLPSTEVAGPFHRRLVFASTGRARLVQPTSTRSSAFLPLASADPGGSDAVDSRRVAHTESSARAHASPKARRRARDGSMPSMDVCEKPGLSGSGMEVPPMVGKTNVEYWDNLARTHTYDEKIISSADADEDGVIYAALDAAATRARLGKEAMSGKHLGGKLRELVAVDVGCGPGKWLPALSARFDHVVGLDISSGLLGAARSVAAAKGLENVEVGAPVDLGRPCEGLPDGTRTPAAVAKDVCGPAISSVAPRSADVVVSVNSLISPDPLVRARVVQRAADMLRPSPASTLLLVVPSVDSFHVLRAAYFRAGGSKSWMGDNPDYSVQRPSEEASNIFRAGHVRTQFFTRESLCLMAEAAGLECGTVQSVPLLRRSTRFLDFLAGVTATPHLLMMDAHPRASVRSAQSAAPGREPQVLTHSEADPRPAASAIRVGAGRRAAAKRAGGDAPAVDGHSADAPAPNAEKMCFI
mmetsp:Transcript_112853/g.319220  ORF Transcript_112853/g.319220 Transcript_112853/m.319220 type:complete len:513 (+) Transcript_112853:83-1621(+)